MVKNLLQQMLDGKYSSKELTKIRDQADYTLKIYQETKRRLEEAKQNEKTNKKLLEIEININKLQQQITKENKKQSKYIVGFLSVGLPCLVALSITSIFGLTSVLIGSLIGVAGLALGALPIAIMDQNKKILLFEKAKQERLRADMLSDFCFNISPAHVNQICKESNQSKKTENTNETENSLSI